jgi:hypothetical protein
MFNLIKYSKWLSLQWIRQSDIHCISQLSPLYWYLAAWEVRGNINYGSHASDPMLQPMKMAVIKCVFSYEQSYWSKNAMMCIYHIINYSWHKVTRTWHRTCVIHISHAATYKSREVSERCDFNQIVNKANYNKDNIQTPSFVDLELTSHKRWFYKNYYKMFLLYLFCIIN